MDAALEASIQSKPQVKGFLCADQNGLLITAKGELNPDNCGKFVAIERDSATLSLTSQSPSILIETSSRNIFIKDYGSMTVVLNSTKDE